MRGSQGFSCLRSDSEGFYFCIPIKLTFTKQSLNVISPYFNSSHQKCRVDCISLPSMYLWATRRSILRPTVCSTNPPTILGRDDFIPRWSLAPSEISLYVWKVVLHVLWDLEYPALWPLLLDLPCDKSEVCNLLSSHPTKNLEKSSQWAFDDYLRNPRIRHKKEAHDDWWEKNSSTGHRQRTNLPASTRASTELMRFLYLCLVFLSW